MHAFLILNIFKYKNLRSYSCLKIKGENYLYLRAHTCSPCYLHDLTLFIIVFNIFHSCQKKINHNNLTVLTSYCRRKLSVFRRTLLINSISIIISSKEAAKRHPLKPVLALSIRYNDDKYHALIIFSIV